MHILPTNFKGMHNVGLYGFANSKFALIGKEIPDEIAEEISKILKVPVHRITIAGTSLIGVFVAGNDDKILVPSIIFDDEKKALEELDIEFEVFETKLTCLGNNMIVTNKKALISKEFSEAEQKRIGSALNIEVIREKLGGVFSVGSLVVINEEKNKALISNDFEREDKALLDSFFEIQSTPGSVNMGSPYIRSGIICNVNGFIIGSNSGGPEITNADEALGFVDNL